jgi:phage-related protein
VAIVGRAIVEIRAIASKFNGDVKKQLNAVGKDGEAAGANVGKQFSEGLQKELAKGKVSLPDLDLSRYENDATNFGKAWSRASHVASQNIDKATLSLQKFGERAAPNMFETFGMGNISMLMKRFFYMLLWGTPIVGALVGAISSLVSGLFALGSALAPAVNTLAVVPGLLTAIVTPALAGILAFQGLGDAYSAGVEALSGGEAELKKYQETLAKLPGPQQAFVQTLLDNRDAFLEVKEAAGSQLFEPLTRALETVVNGGFLPILSDGLAKAGGALGGIAEKVASLTAEPFFQQTFASLMDSNTTVLGSLGDAIRNITELFFTLANAARPVTEQFAAWIATVTGNWASSATGNFSSLRDAIERGAGVLEQLSRILGNVWDGIKNLAEAAAPAGEQLLWAFERATEAFAAFTGDDANQEKFKDFFYDVSINVRALGDLLVEVVKGFAGMGDNPAIKEIADILTNDVVPALFDVLELTTTKVGPEIAKTFEKLVEVFAALVDSGGLEAYLGVIQDFADVLITITNIPGFAQFISFFGVLVGTTKAFSLVVQASGITTFAKGLGNFIAGARGLDSASGAMGRFGSVTASTAGKLKTAFANAGKTIASGITGGLQTAKLGAQMTWDSIKRGAVATAGGFKSVGTAIANGVTSGLQTAKLGAQTTWDAIRNGASRAGGAIKSGFVTAATTLKNGAIAAGQMAKQMGAYAIAAARAGAASAAMAAKTLAVAAAEKAVAAARKIGAAAQWLLNAAMRANPIGIIITLVTALVAAIVWLWNNNEGFRNFIIAAWEGIKRVFQVVVDAIVTAVTWVWDRIQYYWNLIVAVVKYAIEQYYNIVMTVFTAVRDFIMTVWNGIVTAIQNAWNWIVTVVTTGVNAVWTWISTVFNNVWTFITTIWTNIWTWLQTTWNNIVTAVSVFVNTVWTWISTKFEQVRATIQSIWSVISNTLSTIWNNIVTFISTAVNRVWTTVSNVFNNLRNSVSNIFNGIKSTVSSIWNGIYSTISGIVNNIWSNVTSIFGAISGAIGSAFSSVAGTVQSAFSGITGIIRGAINGVIGLVNRAINAINGISVDIPDWVPGVGGSHWGANIGTIPMLAKGGTVAASPGGTLALIAEAGKSERVEPLDANGLSAGDRAVIAALERARAAGGGDINIVINPPPEMDVFTLAKLVSREIEWQATGA